MNLGERLSGLRYKTHLSLKSLSKEVGISSERLSEMEASSDATIRELVAISDYYDIEINWLIQGTEARSFSLDLVLINSTVAAGYLEGKDDPTYFSKLKYYRIPGFRGSNHRLFKVHGESMYPTLSEDDYLVCAEVTVDDLSNGDMVVLVTDSDIVVKRIRKEEDVLILDSDNPKFKSYLMPTENIHELWKVEAKVTKLIESTTTENDREIAQVSRELARMKDEVTSFKADLSVLKAKIDSSNNSEMES